jgi:hypothetical protein
MEVDRVAEVLSVSIAAGHLLDPLDASIERLGAPVLSPPPPLSTPIALSLDPHEFRKSLLSLD